MERMGIGTFQTSSSLLLPLGRPGFTRVVVQAVLARPSESFGKGKKSKNSSIHVATTTADDFLTGISSPPCPKTEYRDNWLEAAAIDYLSRHVQEATGERNEKKGYESLVQATTDVTRKFDVSQQRQLVLEALAAAIPSPVLNLIRAVLPNSKFKREYFAAFTTLFFAWLVGPCEVRESEFNGRKEKNVVHIKKCRFLEQSNCVGMCSNLCKVPSQTFIQASLGLPVNMVPNFDDMSCEMIFGQDPPPLNEDPAFKQPCSKLCMIHLQDNQIPVFPC
ncbi:Beta-carotene isomerase D27, chloroplastic [Linum perenne]